MTLLETIMALSLTSVLSLGVVVTMRMGISATNRAMDDSLNRHSNLVLTRLFTEDVGSSSSIDDAPTCEVTSPEGCKTLQIASIAVKTAEGDISSEIGRNIYYKVIDDSSGNSATLWRISCDAKNPANCNRTKMTSGLSKASASSWSSAVTTEPSRVKLSVSPVSPVPSLPTITAARSMR